MFVCCDLSWEWTSKEPYYHTKQFPQKRFYNIDYLLLLLLHRWGEEEEAAGGLSMKIASYDSAQNDETLFAIKIQKWRKEMPRSAIFCVWP